MKQLIKMSIYFFMLITSITIHAQTIGRLTSEIELNPGVTTLRDLHYVIDSAVYTSGGITFTYPAGWFSSTPTIFTQATESSTDQNTGYMTSVSNNSVGGVTVMVYQINTTGPSVLEATAGDNITVYILAIEF